MNNEGVRSADGFEFPRAARPLAATCRQFFGAVGRDDLGAPLQALPLCCAAAITRAGGIQRGGIFLPHLFGPAKRWGPRRDGQFVPDWQCRSGERIATAPAGPRNDRRRRRTRAPQAAPTRVGGRAFLRRGQAPALRWVMGGAGKIQIRPRSGHLHYSFFILHFSFLSYARRGVCQGRKFFSTLN